MAVAAALRRPFIQPQIAIRQRRRQLLGELRRAEAAVEAAGAQQRRGGNGGGVSEGRQGGQRLLDGGAPFRVVAQIVFQFAQGIAQAGRQRGGVAQGHGRIGGDAGEAGAAGGYRQGQSAAQSGAGQGRRAQFHPFLPLQRIPRPQRIGESAQQQPAIGRVEALRQQAGVGRPKALVAVPLPPVGGVQHDGAAAQRRIDDVVDAGVVGQAQQGRKGAAALGDGKPRKQPMPAGAIVGHPKDIPFRLGIERVEFQFQTQRQFGQLRLRPFPKAGGVGVHTAASAGMAVSAGALGAGALWAMRCCSQRRSRAGYSWALPCPESGNSHSSFSPPSRR